MLRIETKTKVVIVDFCFEFHNAMVGQAGMPRINMKMFLKVFRSLSITRLAGRGRVDSMHKRN